MSAFVGKYAGKCVTLPSPFIYHFLFDTNQFLRLHASNYKHLICSSMY